MGEINNSYKELFDSLLEIIRFHAENNNVNYSESLGLISILKIQIVSQETLFKTEKELNNSFNRETKELYFVLMTMLDGDNIPATIGVLDLLHDFLLQEYHQELNLSFDDNEDEDDLDDYEDYEDYDDLDDYDD